MYRMKENLESVAVVSALLVCAPLVGARQERRAGTDVAVHAKGIAVLSLSFASRGEVSGVSLFVSRDGQTYQDSQAGLLRGSPLFTSTADDGRTTSVLVSLVGRFPYGTYSFLFAEPGTYYLRWGVGFEDNPDAGLKIHQTIEVEPARRCDLDFLARISDARFLRDLLGKDLFEKSPAEFRGWVQSASGADYRSLIVIAELLQATRADNALEAARPRKDIDDAVTWANALLPLAQQLPESSYAPYAAYYAGCCYSAASLTQATDAIRERRSRGEVFDELQEGKDRADFIKHSEVSAKAFEAFAMAARRADAYLKPRVLYQHGYLRLFAFEFDEAERLLSEAAQAAPGEGAVQGWIDEARAGIEVVKARAGDAAKQNGDRANP